MSECVYDYSHFGVEELHTINIFIWEKRKKERKKKKEKNEENKRNKKSIKKKTYPFVKRLSDRGAWSASQWARISRISSEHAPPQHVCKPPGTPDRTNYTA